MEPPPWELAEAVGTAEPLIASSSPKINATPRTQKMDVRWRARGLAEIWVIWLCFW